jgi:enoyl-CoA hydratase/carnithine racemase
VSELVLCDQQDHIATLILNRPEKHNAMSPDMLTASCDYLERLEAAAETRVLVIRALWRPVPAVDRPPRLR